MATLPGCQYFHGLDEFKLLSVSLVVPKLQLVLKRKRPRRPSKRPKARKRARRRRSARNAKKSRKPEKKGKKASQEK